MNTSIADTAIERVAGMMVSKAILGHFEERSTFSKSAMVRINHKTGFEWRDFDPLDREITNGQEFVRIQHHVYQLTDEQFEQAWQRAQEKIAHIPADVGRTPRFADMPVRL